MAQILLSERVGGAETLASELASEWAKSGVDSKTIYLDPTGIKVSRWSRLTQLRKSLSDLEPVVVLAHSFIPSVYARLVWGLRKNVHVVLHSGGDDYARKNAKAAERILQPLGRSVIAVGEKPAEIYKKHFPRVRDLTVIPNGVSTLFNARSKPSIHPRKIVTIARVDPVKRPDIWEEVSFLLAEHFPDMEFEWWGPLSGTPELDNKVLNPRSSNAKYMGSSDNVPHVLSQCDILLHTSDYEASGLALLEAAASGIPVVYADSVAPPSDGPIWDWAFSVGSAAECAKTLRELIANWATSSKVAIEYAQERRADLTIERTAQRYLKWMKNYHPGIYP